MFTLTIEPVGIVTSLKVIGSSMTRANIGTILYILMTSLINDAKFVRLDRSALKIQVCFLFYPVCLLRRF